jgi:HEAT repeat protein
VETLEQAIEMLKSGDASYSNAYPPLSKLRQWPVDSKRRNEVASLLDPLLTAENSTVRRAAQNAIQAWGTRANIPTLLKLLEWQEYGERVAGLEGLAAIGGKEAAEAIAEKMLDKEIRLPAKRALEKMGPVAEEAVWQHVGAGDNSLHSYACQVLGKVGTSKSLVKLKALRERDSGRRASISIAIRDMEKRLVKK